MTGLCFSSESPVCHLTQALRILFGQALASSRNDNSSRAAKKLTSFPIESNRNTLKYNNFDAIIHCLLFLPFLSLVNLHNCAEWRHTVKQTAITTGPPTRIIRTREAIFLPHLNNHPQIMVKTSRTQAQRQWYQEMGNRPLTKPLS